MWCLKGRPVTKELAVVLGGGVFGYAAGAAFTAESRLFDAAEGGCVGMTFALKPTIPNSICSATLAMRLNPAIPNIPHG